MGSEVIARCECGVDTNIRIGGGMASFRTTCYFPCLCEHCSAVVEVNLLGKPPRCPKCDCTKVTPYDEPTLSGRAGKGKVASWDMMMELGRELRLTDGNYRCPQCGLMTLHFENSGLRWD